MSLDTWGRANEKIQDRVYSACRAAGHDEVFVYYSAYKNDEDDNPVDNLDEVVASGTVVVTASHKAFWGEGEDYKSVEITNPTWLDIAVAANNSIRITGDHHHIFLEGVEQKDNVLRMYFGS